MEILIPDKDSLDSAAAAFASALGTRRHVAFRGDMGAGKTTFISALCRHLGMEDEASSPTFSIVNEYMSADGSATIYHFDFYRFESPAEALDIGIDDYFDSGHLCLMEWPDRIAPLLPDDTVDVEILVADDGSRILSFD